MTAPLLPPSLPISETIAPVPVLVPVGVSPKSAPARQTEAPDAIAWLQSLLEQDEAYDAPLLDFPLPTGFRLSVVIPVFNERDTIARVLARVCALPLTTEMVIIDDHSRDGTSELLRTVASADGMRVLFKPRNEGKGAALRDGFALATGDVVVVQDADLEYDPRDILQVIRPIVENRADVVYGSRFLRPTTTGSSRLHHWGNRMLTWASNLTTGLALTDMETCYKAFRREVLVDLKLRQNRFGIEPELTAKVARRGYRLMEVPIRYAARDWNEGKKIGWRDGVNALYCIARYALSD